MGSESLRDCFRESAVKGGEEIAISFLRKGIIETDISFLELDQDSNQIANTFLDMGVKKGDRIILLQNKSLSIVAAHLAIQKIGAISVPLNPGFKRWELLYLVKDADPKLVLLEPEHEEIIKEIDPRLTTIVTHTKKPYQDIKFFHCASDSLPRVEIGPDDPALMVYTSGTTGKPKGVILTQKNLINDARNIIRIWEITESDVICHALPLFHLHGLCFALHTALIAVARVVMLDSFSPEKVIEVLSKKEGEHVCTLFMAVPSMYDKMMDYLVERRPDFEHIRLWTSGSAPLLVRDFERIKSVFGKEPVEREGMSETGMNFSNPLRGVRKPGSIGLPLPGLQVRIVNPETFKDVAQGKTGEIWLKGPAVTSGYWRKSDETSRAFEDGWFRTGDLGRVDEEGYYYLTDRIKHIIISGGENISPREIEMVINQLEDVVESSVVGHLDEKWGEKVVAAVVTKPGSMIRGRDIQKFCKEHLHNWKCPKEILFLKELPKNSLGKVVKEKVKEFFTNRT